MNMELLDNLKHKQVFFEEQTQGKVSWEEHREIE